MASIIHYDDNIFFLSMQIRTLSASCRLDIDADFFLEKIVEDIFLIDRCLETIRSSLRNQSVLIKRNEHLRALLRAEKAFTDLLAALLSGELAFSRHLEPLFPKLEEIRQDRLGAMADIHETLSGRRSSEEPDDDLVTDDEIRGLLVEEEPDCGENAP